MRKVAIVGVEGSGKTVMLAGLGDLYTYPDEEGYFLAPKNFGTAAYVADKIERMRKGEWPTATAGDEMQGLDWVLKKNKTGVKGRPETLCEVSFLDFAGEVYRTAYGISDGDSDASLKEQVESLKQYVRDADNLIVLINLRDVITSGIRDKRVQEAMWITKSILDTALGDDAGEKAPRAAIVLSQADSYAETIKACGGALGVLQRYLPHVANDYGWLDVFAANAVDKTELDDDGNVVPAADFTAKGLLPILKWIRGGDVANGGRGVTALPDDGRARIPAAPQRVNGAPGVCALPDGVELARLGDPANAHGKVQLWEGGPYWAETNIGAEKPEDYGLYFWWGDTIGYKRENEAWVASDGSKSGFSFGADIIPTFGKNKAVLQKEGWITAANVLAFEHDVAHVQWGGEWRIPTKQELSDLSEKCDWSWTSVNGVNGYSVRGRGAYASVRIFLPCAGYGDGTSLSGAGSYGGYWSSVPGLGSYASWRLYFYSSHRYSNYDHRYFGRSVRPVQGFTK